MNIFFDHWNHIDCTVRLAGEMANADAETVRLVSSSKQFCVAFLRVPGGQTFIILSWTSFVMKPEHCVAFLFVYWMDHATGWMICLINNDSFY
jgi:hypothetical protein